MKQVIYLLSIIVSRAASLYTPVKMVRLSNDRFAGYLLPIVIALGIGVSVVGVTALGAISQNGSTLSNSYYNQLASEAAKAGTAAAINCIDNNQMDWDTGGKPPLQPQTDCHGSAVIGKATTVYRDNSIQTTYTVSALQNPYSDTSRVITSTGTTSILAAGVLKVQTFTKVIKTYGKVNFNDGSQLAEQISVGGGSACALVNSKPYCWGSNFWGQIGNGGAAADSSYVPQAVDTSGVLNGHTVTAISTSAAYGFTCAIADGKAYCWGDNANGQLGDGNGGNYNSQSNVPVAVKATGVLSGKTVTDISTGYTHTCAVANGQAYCWGDNSSGQLGDGNGGNYNSQSNVPVAVKTNGVLSGKTVTAISAGNNQTCAIADGKAYCWGGGCGGELGNGQCGSSNVPVAVDTTGVLKGKTVTAISSNEGSTCVVANSQAYCWGNDANGQLGDGNGYFGLNSPVPVAVKTNGVLSGKTVTDISAGNGMACAVASGKGYCWGDNSYGQLGDGTTTERHVPVAVNTSGLLAGKTVTAISAGGDDGGGHVFACAIADSKAYCWGYNSIFGSLGDGTNNSSNVPVTVALAGVGNLQGPTATAISAGDNYACSVMDGRAYCWGYNHAGVLGTGNIASWSWSYIPIAADTSGVLYGKTVTDISANDHTCVVASSKAYCWGRNSNGQLGDNSTTERDVPVAVDTSGVLNGKTVTAISTSDTNTCAIADGKAYCWGNNANGQLGDNTTTERHVPVAVSTSGVLNGKTVTDIDVGNSYACAVADGKAYCWGAGSWGSLGISSGNGSKVPVAVDTSGVLNGKTVTAISAGGEGGTGHTFTCAVADGKAYCWGSNYSDTLGTGAVGLNQSNVPVAVNTSGVLNGKTVTDVSADNDHGCAIADGNGYCWGTNASGQLGDGTTNPSSVPVMVKSSGAINGKAVTAISAGWSNGGASFSCAIASGLAYCWGNNYPYGIGDGTSHSSNAPLTISTIGIPWPLYSFDNPIWF